MRITLDGECLREPETAHAYLSSRLGFPDYYGMNLDALYDCLTQICEDTYIVIECAGDEAEHPYFNSLLEVFSDAEQDNDHLQVVLTDVRGDGMAPTIL